jgi:hypothetical protein
MLFLGLALFAATGAFAGPLIAYNSAGGPDYTATMFGTTLGTLNSLEIFVAGLVLAGLFCFSLWTIAASGRHVRHRRAARLAVVREAGRVRAERDALAARLESAGDGTEAGEAGETGRIRETRADADPAAEEPMAAAQRGAPYGGDGADT